MRVELEREEDGRWLAEVVGIPGVTGVIAYGKDRQHALDAVTKLAREVVAERVAHGEASPEIMLLSFDAA